MALLLTRGLVRRAVLADAALRLRVAVRVSFVALAAALLANRLVWGAGFEVAAVTPGFEAFGIPIIWRHRMLWLFDGGILLAAAMLVRRWRRYGQADSDASGPGGIAVAGGPDERWRFSRCGMAMAAGAGAAGLVATLAFVSGGVTACPVRSPDLWLGVVILLTPLRAWCELRLFRELCPGRGWLNGVASSAGYALWTHGAQAPGGALVERAILFTGMSGWPGACWIAGWDVAGAIGLCREAMAPAKLGLLRNASAASPLWGAAGFDGWAVGAVVALVWRAVAARRATCR